MEYMFNNYNSLTLLNLSNFNTQKVTNMRFMFFNCYSLSSLDLSNFNTQNVANYRYTFYELIINKLFKKGLLKINNLKFFLYCFCFLRIIYYYLF